MALLPEIFLDRIQVLADRPALADRGPGGWSWETWAELGERAVALAAALLCAGLAPGDAVALLGPSRREWVEAELAAMLAGGVAVPIHPDSPSPAALEIVRRASIRFAFAQDPAQAEKLLPGLSPEGTLSRLVVFEPLSRLSGADARGRLEIAFPDLTAARPGGGLTSLGDFLELGRHEVRRGGAAAVERRARAVRPDDPATIVFNWSAAGRPLATVLTHDNVVFTTEGLGRELGVTAADRALLFLPLAHVYPRLLVWNAIQVGYSVAFTEPRSNVLRDAAELAPDFMLVVPRFLEKIRRGLLAEIESGPPWRRETLRWALAVARRRGDEGRKGGVDALWLDAQHAAAERLVYRALRARFGGRLRFLICGGAPLEPDTARFFGDLGIPVVEGYGLTEGTALTAFNRPGRPRPGTVGTPLPGVELRIAADGEVLCRGRNVMRGYLDDPALTAETIDAEGWLRSGDLGRLDAEGNLQLTGRKKDVVVTEGGKNVSPLYLEERLRGDPLLKDVAVIGDRRAWLVALVELNQVELARIAARDGWIVGSPEDAGRNPAVRARLDEILADCNRHLDRFHQVRAAAVVPTLAADGTTGRARREALERRYRAEIDRLYRGA